MTEYRCGQDKTELAQFIELLKRENVCSYLEIGSGVGGALWQIASSLPQGSRIVSLDITEGALPCLSELSGLGYETHAIIGDSMELWSMFKARAWAPYDLCFIDANHTEPYVRSDFENYGALARMVAFHDIGWIDHPTIKKAPIDVPKVWNEIKAKYPHQEIRLRSRNNGIGIIWRT